MSDGNGSVEKNTADLDRLLQIRRMSARYSRSFRGIASIDARAALDLTAGGHVVFVDIRDPAEQEVSMLPGAVTGDELLSGAEPPGGLLYHRLP